ncbi:MAG TPA: DedA family protein [Candidatus Hydrogenedentes bacterium]|nr:DedA family protein [Candidatus Hydrogenedentota bacterium]
MIEQIALWIEHIMEVLGYPGLVLMMALESMVAPVPSEIVMPFAGFLIVKGTFSIAGGIIASSLGTILGSLISYYMGKWGGYPLVIRFGKYLLLDREHLDFTVRWFEKRGEITILICRFIPVVRHLISIPAGVGNMNIIKFSIYTLVGGTIWNTILLFAGIWLKDHWGIIHEYSSQIDKIVVAILVIGGVWWVWKQLQRRKAKFD